MKGSSRPTDKKKYNHSVILHDFMIMLSVCHTVIPEKIDDHILYHAASPGTLYKYVTIQNNNPILFKALP